MGREINASAIRTLVENKNPMISLGLIKEIIVDHDEVLYKVELQPTGEIPLVRASWDYEGKSFGMYVLPEKEDEVLCVFIDQDLNKGIAIKRMNNGIDVLPEGVESNKILFVAKKGHNVDINILEGNVNLTMKGNINAVIDGNVNMTVTGKTNLVSGTVEIKTTG